MVEHMYEVLATGPRVTAIRASRPCRYREGGLFFVRRETDLTVLWQAISTNEPNSSGCLPGFPTVDPVDDGQINWALCLR